LTKICLFGIRRFYHNTWLLNICCPGLWLDRQSILKSGFGLSINQVKESHGVHFEVPRDPMFRWHWLIIIILIMNNINWKKNLQSTLWLSPCTTLCQKKMCKRLSEFAFSNCDLIQICCLSYLILRFNFLDIHRNESLT